MRQFAANRLRGNRTAHLLRFVVEQLHRKRAQLHALVMEVCTLLQLGKATGFLQRKRERVSSIQDGFVGKGLQKCASHSSNSSCAFLVLLFTWFLLTLFRGCTAICLLGLGGAPAAAPAAAIGGLQLDSVEAFEICDAFIEANIS